MCESVKNFEKFDVDQTTKENRRMYARKVSNNKTKVNKKSSEQKEKEKVSSLFFNVNY